MRSDTTVARRPSLSGGGNRFRPAGGFTLIEVIVAFTILGLMAAMVFSSLRFAVNSYQRSQERIEAAARQRVLLDHVRRQLGSLYPLRPTGSFAQIALEQGGPSGSAGLPGAGASVVQFPLFYGQFDTMTFVSVVPLILKDSPGLTIVRYGVAEDEFGERYLGTMEGRFSGLESFFYMAGDPPGTPLAIVDDIEPGGDPTFDYYGFDPESLTFQWFEAWDGQQMQSVPLMVRIRFNQSELVVQVHAEALGGATQTQSVIQNIFQRNQ